MPISENAPPTKSIRIRIQEMREGKATNNKSVRYYATEDVAGFTTEALEKVVRAAMQEYMKKPAK